MFLLSYTPVAAADSGSQLELGIGAGLLSIPDYRGSSHRELYGLPIPYIVYRSERFNIDRSGITGELLKDTRWELDLSMSVSPPVNSEDNPVREGMPDLSPAIEIGPQLVYELTPPSEGTTLKLKLPVRTIIAVDTNHTQQTGWLAQPTLSFTAPQFMDKWLLGIRAGLLIGDAEYHNYFYGVKTQYATETRADFKADSGYSGAYLLTRLSRRYDNYWVGGFLRYDNLSGVAFEDSPLLDEEHSFMAGIAFAWIFHRSSSRRHSR